MSLILYIYLFCLNTVAFFTYGYDKRRAAYDRWRVPEAVLLGMAIAGGAFGALCGMYLFRHKTLHRNFRIIVPVALVVWLALLVALCVLNPVTP